MAVKPENRIKPGDGDPRHGTATGYTNHLCRCLICKKGWATYSAARTAEVRKRNPPKFTFATKTDAQEATFWGGVKATFGRDPIERDVERIESRVWLASLGEIARAERVA